MNTASLPSLLLAHFTAITSFLMYNSIQILFCHTENKKIPKKAKVHQHLLVKHKLHIQYGQHFDKYITDTGTPVSYTHLDVYKRQP